MLLLSSAVFFSKVIFSKNYFRNTIRVSNILESDQDRQFVGPDLVPNCLHMLHVSDRLVKKEFKAQFSLCKKTC